jgi:predicted metal-binding membrane protein
VFPAIAALLVIASVVLTIFWCGSMSGGMRMPGSWTMSMVWMRMSGQSWPGAAASFLAMWTVMMVAMMSPSLVPMLSCYLRSVSSDRLVIVAASGYFAVWTLLGAAVYPPAVLAASMAMRWPLLARSVPLAGGLALLLGGYFQLTSWKARKLVRCRADSACPTASNVTGAWRHGVNLGVDCALCCAGFMTTLLVLGVMDLAVMAAVTAGITFERFARRPERAAQIAGVILIATGAVVVARAV